MGYVQINNIVSGYPRHRSSVTNFAYLFVASGSGFLHMPYYWNDPVVQLCADYNGSARFVIKSSSAVESYTDDPFIRDH